MSQAVGEQEIGVRRVYRAPREVSDDRLTRGLGTQASWRLIEKGKGKQNEQDHDRKNIYPAGSSETNHRNHCYNTQRPTRTESMICHSGKSEHMYALNSSASPVKVPLTLYRDEGRKYAGFR